jgi:hypothetical protein
MPKDWLDELPESCSCWLCAPCSYCMATEECTGCGNLFFEPDVFRNKREHVEHPVCHQCDERFRKILESHQLDCTCDACMAFVKADNAELGFEVAIPLLIAGEHRRERMEREGITEQDIAETMPPREGYWVR